MLWTVPLIFPLITSSRVTGISSSMTVCSEVNFYWHTAMSLGWILCSALNMVFPFWVCGWLSEGNSQECCYTSEISTCEWSRSNLCGPDGLDSMKPQNICDFSEFLVLAQMELYSGMRKNLSTLSVYRLWLFTPYWIINPSGFFIGTHRCICTL